MAEVSNYAACAIERDFIYVAQLLDELEYPSRFVRLTFYLGDDAPVPWMTHDLYWRTSSVCVWRDCPFGGRVYVALSWNGDVELLGPSKRPHIVERIPDRITGPGFDVTAPPQLFGMTSVRQVGHRLYVCGDRYHVFRRDGDGWELITTPALAAESTTPLYTFNDLNGPDESNIYAVGQRGLEGNRVSFFDGSDWRNLLLGRLDRLNTVSVSDRGGVYVAGSDGLLLYGDHRQGFAQVGSNRLQGVIFRAVEFNGILYLATLTGLFINSGPDQPIRRAVTGLDPELEDTITLDVADGVLWCFGRKDLAVFDGHTWTRIHDPENPRIGR